MATALRWRLGLFLFLNSVIMTSGQNADIEIFGENVIIPPSPKSSIHQHSHHWRHRDRREGMIAGRLTKRPHIVSHIQNEHPELKSLSPVHLEMEPENKRWVMSSRTFLGVDSLIPEQIHISPGAEISEKVMRHRTGGRVFGMERHNKETRTTVKKLRFTFKESLHEPVTPTASFRSLSLETAAFKGEPSTRPTPTSKPQVRSVDVTPTLNMALFDWTGYEDLRPADKHLSFNKRKRESRNPERNPDIDVQIQTLMPPKSTSSENVTLTSNGNCKHHLNCLPGSCCNLRNHVCEIHNRGLNNKCYDSCMCEEGLRCYAKLQRHYRITRKKGQCADLEGINLNHGMFIVV
ncbi:draxin isoform X2 [Paramisgurnus dabryanus]|uniref:draxin isoform X2 n=1 Tax=Paramisgurnus dabryanus TaxID=90735 RepID=UPI0031F458D6